MTADAPGGQVQRAPPGNSLPIDPVHFGAGRLGNLPVPGLLTPIRVLVILVSATSMGDDTREAIPLIATVIALIFAMAFVPSIVLFLPNLLT